MNVGDVVLNPKRPGGLFCVIRNISERDDYLVLAPFTTRGWPTKNRRKWLYFHTSYINKLQTPTKKGAITHVYVCPDCKLKGHSWIQSPLRKLDIYTDTYQCQMCKKHFILENGTFSPYPYSLYDTQ